GVAAVGAVTGRAAVESPFVGAVEPTSAAYVPPCAPAETVDAEPVVVQPLNVPVSNPPFVMPEPPPEGLTVSDTLVECVAEAPVPVTVTVDVPTGVEADVVIVIVELLPELIGLGLKLADAPDGSPPAESVTDCDEPLVTVVEIVDIPLWPWVTVTLDGLALIEKSFVCVPPQDGNLNDAIRVCQWNAPLLGMYSCAYQNV